MISSRASCQHSPILLSEGNAGPLGCLRHIGRRGLYAFSTLGNFFFTFGATKKSGGTHQNQSSQDLKLTFSQSDDAE